MGLLAWLGIERGNTFPNLEALVKELRRVLPDDESVVIRYIAIVVVLLGRVAMADGRLSNQEQDTLRALLARIDRMSANGADAVFEALAGKLPKVSEDELNVCYRELKGLCDGRERVEVMRLLAELAASDGATNLEEHDELRAIAEGLGVSLNDLAQVEREVAEENGDE